MGAVTRQTPYPITVDENDDQRQNRTWFRLLNNAAPFCWATVSRRRFRAKKQNYTSFIHPRRGEEKGGGGGGGGEGVGVGGGWEGGNVQ